MATSPAVVEEGRPPLNPDTIRSLGMKLSSDFTAYERDRRQAELRWIQNLRQFLGKYDPDVERNIPADRSKAYPKLTRVKCVSMISRLMNLPVVPGKSYEQVGSSNKDIELLPAIIDLLEPVKGLQEKALTGYNVLEGRLAQVTGTVPADIAAAER